HVDAPVRARRGLRSAGRPRLPHGDRALARGLPAGAVGAAAAAARAARGRRRAAGAEPVMPVEPMIGPASPPDLHIMSYNIRRRATGPLVRPPDRWQVRMPRLTALLQAERPTLLGTQEVMPAQVAAIAAGLGSSYRRVGHG